MNKLMVKTEQNITQGGFHFIQRSGRHTELQLRQHLVDAYAALKKLLVDADDASRFGSVIARSLKIEATYGGSFNSMLTQIALEFGNYIDAIPMILIRLDHRLQGQK
jgi:hypothetical protein